MSLFHILATAANAVLPILLIIFLGYFLRSRNFLSAGFLKEGNRLVFRVLIPSMLFINVYNIHNITQIRWDFVVFCCVMVLILFAIGIVTSMAATPIPQRRGVLLQCSFRSNLAIIGLSLAGTLGGEEAQAVIAVVSAVTIPLFNILAVISLTVFTQDSGRINVRKLLRSIAVNPMILGVSAGLVCLALRSLQTLLWGHPVFLISRQLPFLYSALTKLKQAASPIALMILGGQFQFSAVRGLLKEIVVGTASRVVLAPAVGIGAAALLSWLGVLSCGPNEYPTLIALFGAPVAVPSAIMAAEMGADEQLAAQLLIWTCLCSILTLFLEVCILMAFGLIVV